MNFTFFLPSCLFCGIINKTVTAAKGQPPIYEKRKESVLRRSVDKMLEYIKMLIMSFVSGAFSALPVSSSAHYAFLNSVLHFSEDTNTVGFYFSVISATFSLVVFFFLRKLYTKALGAVFGGKSKKSDIKKQKQYKSIALNLLLSLLPALIMLFPVSKTEFMFDLFDDYFSDGHLMVTSFCCIAGAVLLSVAIWYARNKTEKTVRSTLSSGVVRFGIYQLPAYFFPGFSHVGAGAAALTVSSVDDRVIAREVLLYLAPSGFVVSVARIVRYILAGVTLDPVMIIVCVLACVLSGSVVVNALGRINVRKLYLFSCLYSAVFGIFIFLASFYI